MDVTLSEQQELLQQSARDFLLDECPITLVRAMEKDEKGYPPALWRQMAELGWLGLIFPEQYEGVEAPFSDLAVLVEEFGRFLVPSPYIPTVVLTGITLLKGGTDAQKKMYLPQIARGELLGTLAMTEESARFDPAGIQMPVQAKDGSYILNGTKLFVPFAHVADLLVCPVRTSPGTTGDEGITLLLVDGKAQGIHCEKLQTIADDHQCAVVFQNVRVPVENVLGKVGQGWSVLQAVLDHGVIARCAEMVGIAQRAFEMSVQYAKERVQFGRPIGSFQAIKHKCADMVVDVDGSRYITYRAAWNLGNGFPATLDVAMAKTWVSDACRRVVKEAHQIHGGIGYTLDYDLQLYFRRAKAAEVAFGDANFHRERVATALDL
jgi:alkylation response protein AidB-like acyl-CoA dehydrogenase